MDQNMIKILFALLRSVIRGNQLNERERELVCDQALMEAFKLAKSHDIAHLVAYGIDINKLSVDNEKQIQYEMIKSVYRYEHLNYDFIELIDALEAAKIPFIPLKGAVIRNYYPEPWMRTSCDIDILVRKDDVEKASNYLVENLGYVCDWRGSHDISLYSPNNIHIELHYSLVEDDKLSSFTHNVLKNVWNDVLLKKDYLYWYEMTDKMFYFYHIVHMAKHFEEGGCGIRPFIDLWFLDNMENINQHERNALLEQGGLLRFAEASRCLCRVWLDETEHTDITSKMEQFVLCGGVYGSIENRVEIQQGKRGGKIRYIFSRIFLPYEILKYEYPCLVMHKWLTPIMEVRRWFRLIFKGRMKRAVRELKYTSNAELKGTTTQAFLKSIGL